METKTIMQQLKGFYTECSRVLRVTKKPSNEEFKVVVKVTGIGMLIIGFIGFAVTMIRQYLGPIQ